MPAEQILAALTGGGAAGGQAGQTRRRPATSRCAIVPVVDGRTLPAHPFEPGASDALGDIPMMCGSNESEGMPYGNPDDPYWTSEPTDARRCATRVKRIVRGERCGGGSADRAVPKEPPERQPRRHRAR